MEKDVKGLSKMEVVGREEETQRMRGECKCKQRRAEYGIFQAEAG
jgi:hypothetical protein